MDDESEQLEEIMALQNIYEDCTFLCNVNDKPITGKFSIIIEADSKPYSFTCNGEMITIKYLSPLILNFSLPSNYPSVSPPDITLSCLWLTPQQLEILSNKLNEKWTENCNTVVLFSWINFLQTEAIEMLDIKFPIDVSEDKIIKLKEQSNSRQKEVFNRGLHFCPICFLERPGSQCIRLPMCGHLFCKDCLAGFLSVYIQEGSIRALICPSKKCKKPVCANVIKSLVSESDFVRYDRLLLQTTLDIMPDVTYCPRVQCNLPVVVDKSNNMGYCDECNFAFCVKCNQTYHGVELCKFEREQMDKEHQRTAYKAAIAGGKNRSSEAKTAAEWIGSNTKKCPECSINIEKNMGCNTMACSRCGCVFCWSCMEVISSPRSTVPRFHMPGCAKPPPIETKKSKRPIKTKRPASLKQQNGKLPTEENVEASEKISETTTDLPNGQSDVDKNISESITILSAEKADEDQKITAANAIPLAENLDAYGNVSEDLQELDRNEQNRQMELWISSNTKRCPKCGTNLMKPRYGNLKKCNNCGCTFCWLCLQKLKRKNSLDHFYIPSSPCYRKNPYSV